MQATLVLNQLLFPAQESPRRRSGFGGAFVRHLNVYSAAPLNACCDGFYSFPAYLCLGQKGKMLTFETPGMCLPAPAFQPEPDDKGGFRLQALLSAPQEQSPLSGKQGRGLPAQTCSVRAPPSPAHQSTSVVHTLVGISILAPSSPRPERRVCLGLTGGLQGSRDVAPAPAF